MKKYWILIMLAAGLFTNGYTQTYLNQERDDPFLF